jgi:hypothetical protein
LQIYLTRRVYESKSLSGHCGVLLAQASNNGPQIILARYAKEFLQFCLNNFECNWLTTHCKDNNPENAINYLSRYTDEATLQLLSEIQPTRWNTLKTETIDFESDFFG